MNNDACVCNDMVDELAAFCDCKRHVDVSWNCTGIPHDNVEMNAMSSVHGDTGLTAAGMDRFACLCPPPAMLVDRGCDRICKAMLGGRGLPKMRV